MKAPPPDPLDIDACRARIRDLELRLEESEDTLEALRRGDFDAVVVQGPDSARLVYTLAGADRPYRVLIEQFRDGALTVGDGGLVLYCNARLAEMLDVAQERLIGKSLLDFVAEPDRAGLAALLRDAAEEGARKEVTLRSAIGREVPAQVSLSLLQRDETMPILCGVVTDRSEQRRHVRDLADANGRLEAEMAERARAEDALRQSQKMEAVGQLTGGIAHDFNNLLTVIRSSTDLLRRPDLAEERRRRYVDAISETVDRAARLTGQLLAFARRQPLRPEVFDVGARIHHVTDLFASLVGSRVRIVADIGAETCFAEADVSQFETALVNLAVNARDAMDGEGVLRVEVRPDARPRADDLRGRFVAVSVADDGCGIPADRIGRIFEPFFTTKEVGKGTGLGLSQVFGFTKQSGGTVEVDSEPGRGTTFTLFLPRVAGGDALARPAMATVGEGPVPHGHGRRVLVVEDNAEVGAFATRLLEDLGYATTWAPDAAEALRRLEGEGAAFDVVFSDVVMPGMNGVDLANAVRRRYPEMPVVLTTGYSDTLVDADHRGFELLRKPYSIEQLSRVLREAIHAGRGERLPAEA